MKKNQKKRFKTVDEYIASFPKKTQAVLVELRRTIKDAAPIANERISYGMPFYEYGGSGFNGRIIYFSVSKDHVSIYIPPSLFGKQIKTWKQYQVTKSAFYFSLDEPLPFALIAKTVKALIKNKDVENKKDLK